MNIDQFLHNLELLPKRIEENCRLALSEVLQQMVSYARANHPYKDRSGNLTASIGADVGGFNSGKISASFYALAEYAQDVEYGTHRGSPPLPFMRPTIERFKPELEAALQRAMQSALEEALK